MPKDEEKHVKTEPPLDDKGLDPDVRGRILSYGAPDRRKQAAPAGPTKRRRRDDSRENA
jgi:hypothetical protein